MNGNNMNRIRLQVMWDRLLSAGREVWGIAVDDAHHFTGEFAAGRSNPGRGWVVARTGKLDRASILEAMDRGDFYSSTGVTLGDLSISKTGVRLCAAWRGENDPN